ncbi:DUF1810 domain-containing protein [Marinihelvus fidelis]|uniref:DUF1810 domain-containing protein n=1 Tax=Marinihelvus fidelis TaxID=2613842 RepID=A0A5N0T8P2_9GAMM|nr:DUF1810 domain-containing protein [Marinihelvus fidelis]KAA9129669.1 DUF1810 domain-containing protein [Marinihelvus fidelis]
MSLARFEAAQDDAYPDALEEIRAGEKYGHWMWFVFPQLRGLGRSETSEFFGIRGAKEALAYVQDPVLGARLVEASAALLELHDRTAEDVFGEVDTMKLCSSMTLFACVSPSPSVFEDVLERFFDGERDPRTLEMLGVE